MTGIKLKAGNVHPPVFVYGDQDYIAITLNLSTSDVAGFWFLIGTFLFCVLEILLVLIDLLYNSGYLLELSPL